MIKRILALAIVLATVLMVLASCSDTDKNDNPPPTDLEENPEGDFKYKYDASINGVVITEYIGDKIKVRIPEKIEGEPVVAIGDRAFQNSGIMEIYIPNSVTLIGISAFNGCTGLTDITIPDSVTLIGSAAFVYCTGLTSITIPDSMTQIGDEAFYGCTGYATYKDNTYDLSNSDDVNALCAAINGGQ